MNDDVSQAFNFDLESDAFVHRMEEALAISENTRKVVCIFESIELNHGCCR